MFFKKKTTKTEKAFGKIPAYCKYELFMERYRSAAEFISDFHRNRAKLKLLDVGSGEGYLKFFCDFGQIDWHGIEIWEERFKICQELGYQMHRCNLDTEPLPFDNESFDVVVGSHVLEHLANRSFCLQEMGRVLKTGGMLILGVPIKPIILSHLVRFVYRFKPKGNGNTMYAFDIRSIKKLLTHSLSTYGGFEIMDIRGFRLISARRITNWENSEGFYKFNTWFGKHFPGLTPEVNLVIRKVGRLSARGQIQPKAGE